MDKFGALKNVSEAKELLIQLEREEVSLVYYKIYIVH